MVATSAPMLTWCLPKSRVFPKPSPHSVTFIEEPQCRRLTRSVQGYDELLVARTPGASSFYGIRPGAGKTNSLLQAVNENFTDRPDVRLT